MRTKFLIISLVGLTTLLASCMQNPQGEKAKTGEATKVEVFSTEYKQDVDFNNSSIEWLGTKPTGTHNGTISLKQGAVYIKDGKLLGGKFVIDMNSINVLDIEDPEMNQNLLNHLKSVDFFMVDSFPTASFEFSNIIPFDSNNETAYEVKPTHEIEGNLTLRGTTKKISFPAYIEITDKGLKASTPQFLINRTNWNVNYGSKSIFSNLKDNFVHDEIGITIKLSTY
ncbi:MAG: YceI family protein [Bacteroidales bacterium]|nr:YceI family protein [Bacteroidales bacterium]MDD4385043.1 YceI family protein [Bacteroidales bacterium]MDY0196649.1 YceI family protein [Tenuifilaceae bacterium]